MPNHIMNHVTFRGKKDNVNKAIETLGPTFDLNKISAEPEGLDREVSALAVEEAKKYIKDHANEDPKEYAEKKERLSVLSVLPKNFKEDFLSCVENYRKYGYFYWLDWRKDNWGTKWNTYDHGDFGHFLTANSTCREAYRRISEQFGISVEVKFADEDEGYNCGIIKAKNGILTEWNPEPGSEQAIMFAESVWSS